MCRFTHNKARPAALIARNPLALRQTDSLKSLDANRLYVIQEGGKILKSGPTPGRLGGKAAGKK